MSVESRWALQRTNAVSEPVLEINRDITARFAAEQNVRRSERHLRFITDSAPILLAHCDREERFKFVNNLYAARFGYRSERVGRPHDSRRDRRERVPSDRAIHQASARWRVGQRGDGDRLREAGSAVHAVRVRAGIRRVRHGCRFRRRDTERQRSASRRRTVARARSAQGRVPRHAGSRAPQSAGADAICAASLQNGRRTRRSPCAPTACWIVSCGSS